MKPDENAEAFVNSFDEIVTNLMEVDEKFTDREASLYLLISLPSSLEGIKTAIESRDVDDYEKVKKRIVGHWLRRETWRQ